MPSILVFENSFDPNISSTWPNARREGQRYCGERLIYHLGNTANPRDCILNTLNDCNTGNYGVWLEVGNYVRIVTIQNQGNKRIRCNYGTNKRLIITVEEDDDGNSKKMTVVVPGDRSSVIGNPPYVVSVATDVDTLFGNGSGNQPLDAGRYILSSITFRRCQ